MARLGAIPFDEPLAERLAKGPGDGVSLYWLGQAGFVIDADGKRIVIDPYLSDSLAGKYRNSPYSHARMAPPPITPDEIGAIDLVLCTHHHTDHMDGETLTALAARQPHLKFVVPAASVELAMQRIGVGTSRLILVDAGLQCEVEGISVTVLRAAHETLERDAEGRYRFLGYGLAFGGVKIFHSGDTVPFDGQVEEIRSFHPDLALLPVNGRSDTLSKAGFAGNFMLEEAILLCERCKIDSMIAHHYGMFAFNTVSSISIDEAAANTDIYLLRAKHQMEFRLEFLQGKAARVSDEA